MTTPIPAAAVEAAVGVLPADLNNDNGAWPGHYMEGWNNAMKLVREEIPAALTAALPHLSGWRPIAEAPRDGTDVFVYVRGDSLYPTAAHYSSREYFEKEYGDPEYMEEGWYWSFGYPSDFHEEVIEPTYFRPIDAPPGQEVDGGR